MWSSIIYFASCAMFTCIIWCGLHPPWMLILVVLSVLRVPDRERVKGVLRTTFGTAVLELLGGPISALLVGTSVGFLLFPLVPLRWSLRIHEEHG